MSTVCTAAPGFCSRLVQLTSTSVGVPGVTPLMALSRRESGALHTDYGVGSSPRGLCAREGEVPLKGH